MQKGFSQSQPQPQPAHMLESHIWNAGIHPPHPGRHPPADTPGQTTPPPPPADGYCSRWFASYWNAFLFGMLLGFSRAASLIKTIINYRY